MSLKIYMFKDIIFPSMKFQCLQIIISETIHPKTNIVHLEVDLYPITLLPEHLDPDVEQQEVFPISFSPQSSITIESSSLP